jgi:hypothetical protein
MNNQASSSSKGKGRSKEPVSILGRDDHSGEGRPVENASNLPPDTAGGDAEGGVLTAAQKAAGDAFEQAKVAISDTTETLTSEARRILDRQVGKSGRVVGDVGQSIKRAAEELDSTVPALGQLAHAFANQMDRYSSGLSNSSVDDLLRSASRLTREQPALVFGATALAGFLVFRTLKSAAPAAEGERVSRDSSSGSSYEF